MAIRSDNETSAQIPASWSVLLHSIDAVVEGIVSDELVYHEVVSHGGFLVSYKTIIVIAERVFPDLSSLLRGWTRGC